MRCCPPEALPDTESCSTRRKSRAYHSEFNLCHPNRCVFYSLPHAIESQSNLVPTRSTSYTHLRDAFLRSLHSRLRLALSNSTITREDELRLQTPLRVLKSIFPSTPLAKYTPLDILLSPPSKEGKHERTLLIRDLGAVQNDWIGTEFMLAYFEGDGPSPAVCGLVVAHASMLISFF
jgi:hypothetical protein